MYSTITDVQFIAEFNISFGERYEKAKNLHSDAPIQTLVELRSLLNLLCNELIEEAALDFHPEALLEYSYILQNVDLLRYEKYFLPKS